jgi:hypothetical protein
VFAALSLAGAIAALALPGRRAMAGGRTEDLTPASGQPRRA